MGINLLAMYNFVGIICEIYLNTTDYIMLHNADFSFFLFVFRQCESSITLILLLFWLCMRNINSWLVSSSFLFCRLRFVWLNEVSRVSNCLYFWSELPQLQEQSWGGGGGGAENSEACFSKSRSKCNFIFSNWNKIWNRKNIQYQKHQHQQILVD